MALGNEWDSKVLRESAVPVYTASLQSSTRISLQFSACQLHFLLFLAVFTEQDHSPSLTFHSFSLERDELKISLTPIFTLLNEVHTRDSILYYQKVTLCV